MTLETGQTRVPDYCQIWRRLVLKAEEGLLPGPQHIPLRVREATHDLTLSLRTMLFDPTLESDPQRRLNLIDQCSLVCATLAELGVEKDAAVGKDEDGQHTALQIATFAAGLLVNEDFARIPTHTAFLLEAQEQASHIIEASDGKEARRIFRIKPENITPGIRRWFDISHKTQRVAKLLAFE